MARYVIRVWVADLPGALGMLTTALGEKGADVIGINILERDGGRAVDELTVSVPVEVGAEELARALNCLEAVQVEDVRSVVDRLPYPGSDPLDVAVELSQQGSAGAVMKTLAHGVASVFAGDWAVVLPTGEHGSELASEVESVGTPPAVGWLSAFVSGTSSQQGAYTGELRGPSDVAWAFLEHRSASVVVGRGGPPFRSRERHQLLQLSRIADLRWRDLTVKAGMIAHPSVGQSERTVVAAS